MKVQQPVCFRYMSVKRLPVFKSCSVIVKSTCDWPASGFRLGASFRLAPLRYQTPTNSARSREGTPCQMGRVGYSLAHILLIRCQPPGNTFSLTRGVLACFYSHSAAQEVNLCVNYIASFECMKHHIYRRYKADRSSTLPFTLWE